MEAKRNLPKIIFSDIDGTLLLPDSTVSPGTAAAVRQLAAQTIPFILVSARMPEAIYPLTRQMGVTLPVISYSGAYVLTAEQELLFSQTMAAEPTRRILADIAAHYPAIVVNYYAGRHWYVRNVADPQVQQEMRITSAQAVYADYEERLQADELPNKLLLMAEPTLCARAEKELAARYPEFHVVRSAPFLLEIMERSVSKATGIAVMLKHYGLTAADALSFGDNYNDLEMLQHTGTSVAMGNAPEDVKKAATCVTAPNTEDGLARYLQQQGIID